MSVFLADPDVTLHHGDALAVLAGLPDGCADCCVTSPPYWGLRDYGEPGQLGLEPTPDEYVARMVEVFREVRRVLADHGTLWLNLGDSYNSNPSWGRGRSTLEGRPQDQIPGKPSGGWLAHAKTDTLKSKDLVGIPWRVAFALQADGWYLRSDIVWSKPNPMPESVTDRPTKAHEYVFLLTKRPRYFFDQEAVREPAQPRPVPSPEAKTISPNGETPWLDNRYAPGASGYGHHPNGRNVRSVWEIATQPYPEAHFATYPEELVRRCILAGTSERGCCPECGKPWERVVDLTPSRPGVGGGTGWAGKDDASTAGPRQRLKARGGGFGDRHAETVGWRPSCDHDQPPRPAVVLDPFLGSGTTAHVARKHGRRAVGIELNPDYCRLAARRLAQQTLFAEQSA